MKTNKSLTARVKALNLMAQVKAANAMRTAQVCATCGKSIATGSPLKWDRNTRQTYHADCN